MTRIRLSRKLHLEEPHSVPDGAGGYRIDWRELGVLWGDVRPVSGERVVQGDPVQFVDLYRLVIRAAPVGSPRRPRSAQRFRMGVRVFRITSVSEHDDAGRYLACMGQEEQVS